MNASFYKHILEALPTAYGYHRIICDDAGKPIDCEVIDINPAYERITGLSSGELRGRRITELMPTVRQGELDLVALYGRVALTGEKLHINSYYSKELKRWYRVTAFSPEKMTVVTLFSDITEEMERLVELDRLFDINLDLLCIADTDGRFVRVNAEWEEILGHSKLELEGRLFLDFIHPDDIEATRQAMSKLGQQEQVLNFINRYKCRDGSYRYLEWRSQPFGRRIYAAARDITARVNSQHALFLEKESLRTTLLSIGDGVITVDQSGCVVLMNWVAEKLTGWTQADACGRPLTEVFNIVNEYTRVPCENPALQAMERGEIVELSSHTILISRNGSERPVEDSAAPIRDEHGNALGVVLVFRDVSEQRAKQERIEYLSFHDQLTGLYNRRFFEVELKRLDTRRNLPITLVMFDVNGLKLTNDAFGHQVGDQVLKRMAEVVRGECRCDDIISRIGGDEFVILLPKTDAYHAAQLVKRIMERVDKEVVSSIGLSASFGWATKESECESMAKVLKQAEDLMYRHKLSKSTSMRHSTLGVILRTLYEKNSMEEMHSKRVSSISVAIGKALGLSDIEIGELRTMGLMHDIGKIALDDKILKKPGPLSDSEWQDIRRHPEIGYRILSSVNEYASLARYVLTHHERLDGKGYPNGLSGEEIPLSSRIITVADAYDAMTSDRAYRKGLSREEALQELKRNAGTQFDTQVVAVLECIAGADYHLV